MKPQAIASCLIIRNRFLWMITLTFTCITATSQRILKPNVYKNFIKSDALVKVQTIEGGEVKKTDVAALNTILIPVDKKKVIPYENKISAIDMASYQKFKTTSPLPYAAEDVKIIPELHVESSEGQTEDIAYRIMFTLQQPLHYNDTLKKFIARLGFLLMSESGSINSSIEPVGIEVTSNEVTSIKPESFQINHLSIPSSNVELIAEQVNDSASVKVITASHPEGYTTYLKVRPILEISTNRNQLQGFGIQEIPVNVRFVGSNSSDSVKVSFSTEKGTVTPNSVYVNYNKTTTVYLRSEGTGNSKLSATSATTESNELIFSFTFPWLFLLATVIGGIIGSFIKYYSNAGEKKLSAKLFIGGILTGFVGAAAYYVLGINLLGLSLSATFNEIAVLVISALFAYLGIRVLKLENKQ